MKKLFVAALLVPAIALAHGKHHPAPPPPTPAPVPAPTPPPPTPVPPAPAPAPSSGGSDAFPVVVGIAGLTALGFAIYKSRDEKGREKRVELAPSQTSDGKISPTLRIVIDL